MNRIKTSLLVFALLSSLMGCAKSNNDSTPTSPDTNQPAAASEISAMDEAIQDEYRSLYTYQKVATSFNNTAPFGNIAMSESQHIAELSSLYMARGLPAPQSNWNLTNVPTYSSIAEACTAGVQSEQQNIAMYDRLLKLTLSNDIRTTFTRLQSASRDQHLPAFQQCQ